MSLSNVKIGFIGGGCMASAMIKGLIQAGTPPANITVTVKTDKSVCRLREAFPGSLVSNNNVDAIVDKDVIILAVKPQVASMAITPVISHIQSTQLVVSVMAGYDLHKLRSLLNHTKNIRVMPNTPCLVRQGASVFCPDDTCTESDVRMTELILLSMGLCERIPESCFNAATAISGCGPAYVFMFMEAMADAGVAKGLPRTVALKLAAQTMVGAGTMVLETGQHPGVLKDNVCSPGGVTISGVTALEEAGFRGAVISGVKAAAARADEMTSMK